MQTGVAAREFIHGRTCPQLVPEMGEVCIPTISDYAAGSRRFASVGKRLKGRENARAIERAARRKWIEQPMVRGPYFPMRCVKLILAVRSSWKQAKPRWRW
jgi:hypothetical protein